MPTLDDVGRQAATDLRRAMEVSDPAVGLSSIVSCRANATARVRGRRRRTIIVGAMLAAAAAAAAVVVIATTSDSKRLVSDVPPPDTQPASVAPESTAPASTASTAPTTGPATTTLAPGAISPSASPPPAGCTQEGRSAVAATGDVRDLGGGLGAEILTCNAPDFARGLAIDGATLWVADSNGLLFHLDAELQVIGVVEIPSLAIAAMLAHEGTVWAIASPTPTASTFRLIRVDATTGAVLSDAVLPGSSVEDGVGPFASIAADGNDVWVAVANGRHELLHYSADGSLIATVPLSSRPGAVAADAGHAFVITVTGEIDDVDASSGAVSVLADLASPSGAVQIAVNGNDLWADADELVHIDLATRTITDRVNVATGSLTADPSQPGRAWVAGYELDPGSGTGQGSVVRLTAHGVHPDGSLFFDTLSTNGISELAITAAGVVYGENDFTAQLTRIIPDGITAPVTAAQPAAYSPSLQNDPAWLWTYRSDVARGASHWRSGQDTFVWDEGDSIFRFVNTTTDQLTAPNGILHGGVAAVAAAADGYVVALTGGPVEFDQFSADGRQSHTSTVEFPPGEGAPTAITIAAHGETVYALIEDQSTTPQGVARFARIDGDNATVLSTTIYGRITFDAAGDIIVISASDPSQRSISTDGGNTWNPISIAPSSFSHPVIISNLDARSVLAYDHQNPTRIATIAVDGTATNNILVVPETTGWVAVSNSDPKLLQAVGQVSGMLVSVDSSGTEIHPPKQQFKVPPGDTIVAAWRNADGIIRALATNSTCTTNCPMPTVLEPLTQ